jgi:hypothetical protein
MVTLSTLCGYSAAYSPAILPPIDSPTMCIASSDIPRVSIICNTIGSLSEQLQQNKQVTNKQTKHFMLPNLKITNFSNRGWMLVCIVSFSLWDIGKPCNPKNISYINHVKQKLHTVNSIVIIQNNLQLSISSPSRSKRNIPRQMLKL